MDKLQKVRDKHGYQPSDDNMSTRLIQAEKVREVQRENKKLADIISKQRTIHTWFRSKSRSKLELMSADFQSNTDRTTKENLEKGICFLWFLFPYGPWRSSCGQRKHCKIFWMAINLTLFTIQSLVFSMLNLTIWINLTLQSRALERFSRYQNKKKPKPW